MAMKQVNVSELSGAALDYAVDCIEIGAQSPKSFMHRWQGGYSNYSENWAQGGPIIERKEITLGPFLFRVNGWHANKNHFSDPVFCMSGETPLIAAMRCYVASKMGTTIEIPEELL